MKPRPEQSAARLECRPRNNVGQQANNAARSAQQLSRSAACVSGALAVLPSSSRVGSDRNLAVVRRANAERQVPRRGRNISCLIAHQAGRGLDHSAEQASAAQTDLRRGQAVEASDTASSVSWSRKVEWLTC